MQVQVLSMFAIAPAISHTHLCSVWLYPHSQTHRTGARYDCFCTAKRTRIRSQHPSSFSCLSFQLQGRDFKLKERPAWAHTPSDPLYPTSSLVEGGTNKLRMSLALLLSSFTVKNSGCFCSASNCSNGSNSHLLAQSAMLACVGTLANNQRARWLCLPT